MRNTSIKIVIIACLDQNCILNIIKNAFSCHHQHHYKCKILSILCVSLDGGLKSWGHLDSVSHHHHSRQSTSSSLSSSVPISSSFKDPCLRRGGPNRVAEVAREHGWHPPKSLDSAENFKPKHTLFCRELRFVAIYALFGDLWAKKCLFGSKTVFLGQEVHYYMVYCILWWIQFSQLRGKTINLSEILWPFLCSL